MKMSENQTLIVYLSGKPGAGKYTIAKALSQHGFIVCDNQLINNPIFELLNYDGFAKIPDFGWDAIGRLRNVVFDFLKIEQNNNYVLTNNLYEDGGIAIYIIR
jgi:predicted ATPase